MTAVPAPPPAPAPEAATPDPASMEAALAEALKGMRVSVTVDAIEATAGTVAYPAQLAAMLWPALAPAWDALTARLAEAEAALEEIEGMWDTTSADPEEMAANMAITAHNALNRPGGDRDAG